MNEVAREIKRLVDRIPTDFPCIPGCTDCCGTHAWTKFEWSQVKHKLRADNPKAKCPYATTEGCSCYDKRPVICRLYGNADYIGTVGPFWNVPLLCPRGIKSDNPLSREEARDIFLKYIAIIQRGGAAGPYAQFKRSGR